MIWKTPNGAAFVDRIHQDLSGGKNVVCVLPKPHLDDDFTPALGEQFYNNSQGRLVRLDAANYPGIVDLVSFLNLGWNWGGEGADPDEFADTLEALWHYFAQEPYLKFAAVTGLDQLPEDVQARIAENVSEWARFSRQSRTAGQDPLGLRFLILASPAFPSFSSDLFLTVHHWWAQTDIVDHQWALSRLLAANPAQSLAQDWWLKAVCRALGYDDLSMIKLIIDDPPFDFDQIKALIRRHPLFSVSRTVKFQNAQFLQPLSLALPSPPDRNPERALWAAGLFSYGPHYFPHPVIMDDDQLKFCISLGQRQVFLPLVDHVQSMLCKTIEDLFGDGVWDFYEKDSSQRSSIVAEISPLAYFVKNILPRHKWPNLRKRTALIDLASAWREIRHIIAHNKMLDFNQLEVAFEQYNACIIVEPN